MKFKHGNSLFFGTVVTLALAGCGGGGTSTTVPTPLPPVANAPTATVTLSTNKAKTGDNVAITWNSTDATSCVGSDALSTNTTSGATAVTAVPGQTKFTLTCTGAGGSKIVTATLAVPLPVLASSYENKMEAVAATGPQNVPIEGGGSNTFAWFQAYAFADFFQDGSYSMVSASNIYSQDANATQSTAKVGKFMFWQKDSKGTWVNKTSDLLTNDVGCLHPRKAIVADFNNDGKPDVFIACHGFDKIPFPGEQSHVLLSQADGKYTNVAVGNTDAFTHGASAADVNGDGNVDIVIADMRGQSGLTPVYFLMGDGKGGFTIDYNRAARPEFQYKQAFWTTELIKTGATGYTMFIGGDETFTNSKGITSQGSTTQFVQANATGMYVNTPSTPLISTPTATVVLDFIVGDGNVYIARTLAEPYYGGSVVQKINIATGNSTVIQSSTGKWIDWLAIQRDNVVSVNAAFGLQVKK